MKRLFDLGGALLSLLAFLLLTGMSSPAPDRELHVSVKGDDAHDGTAAAPLRTIQRAADLARPGDTITVHAGVYRERVTPPRGGESDARRIVYRAAPGENVVIKGSEVVKGWKKMEHDTWKVVLPNRFFGDFNPYNDLIRGDWFNRRGRDHHTGAVYLDGHWLIEAAKLEDVLKPGGAAATGSDGYLLNVAWLRPGGGKRTPADGFASQNGIQTAPCSEGGKCIGWIDAGDWVRYERVDCGKRAEQVEIRAASETVGGTIEIRLDKPDGELLGSCSVPNTGGWQKWASFKAKVKPLSGVKTLCLVFRNPKSDTSGPQYWFGRVDEENTTIWAQFKGVDPNEKEVEINVRRTVFYPAKPGVNYLTVRGFTMCHAATPWAPPTAEQVGLIGTHWSKGWIIEHNSISHSVCTGITLGKYGDEFDNTSANTAEGYVKTIERGLKNGWNKETVGHHIVRNNTISHCEQAGLVGSLGPVFSTITGNTIHDIHVRRLFSGAEMGGIKLHAAIDVEISRNHIYRTCRGIWLDWMAQGTRVTGNLLHENRSEDLFVEVNHGPFLIDNNIFLSPSTLRDWSQGGAYAHNLIAGRSGLRPQGRSTPYHKAHTTEVAGLLNIKGGDDRFYNNIFTGSGGLTAYDKAARSVFMDGNVFLQGAKPSTNEKNPALHAGADPAIRLVEKEDGFHLEIAIDKSWLAGPTRKLVTTELLGKAAVPNVPYERPDGTKIRLDTDYFGRKRNAANPLPGPFAEPPKGTLKVWPLPGSGKTK